MWRIPPIGTGNHGYQFGFFTEVSICSLKECSLPELNSGFEPLPWLEGCEISCLSQDEAGCFLDSENCTKALGLSGERKIPLSFKCRVPVSGNYQVTIRLKAAQEEPEILLFLGRRRLAWKGSLQPGPPILLYRRSQEKRNGACACGLAEEQDTWKEPVVRKTAVSILSRLTYSKAYDILERGNR